MNLLTFQQCRESAPLNHHLLLGNGFSRACRDNIFSYNSLFNAADFDNASEQCQKAFSVLKTTDFEQVMKTLGTSAQLSELYSGERSLADKMEQDAACLRKLLVETITAHHPEHPGAISEQEYNSCRRFLGHFQKIYTLNYDLLLYWTVMKDRQTGKSRDDGFRDPYEGPPEHYQEETYVEWSNPTNTQDIHYLHGALHLFYKGGTLQKYSWNRTGVRLLDQIDASLKEGKFPLIVAEGGTEQKHDKIQHSSYLGYNFRSLGKIGGSLFVYGHSMAANDQHVLREIGRNGKIKNLFVSIYGDPDLPHNREIIAAARAIGMKRPQKKPLAVEFYAAETANVWR